MDGMRPRQVEASDHSLAIASRAIEKCAHSPNSLDVENSLLSPPSAPSLPSSTWGRQIRRAGRRVSIGRRDRRVATNSTPHFSLLYTFLCFVYVQYKATFINTRKLWLDIILFVLCAASNDISLQLNVSKLFGKHAERLDREDELVVRIGNHAAKSCQSLLHCFHYCLSINTHQLLLKTPSMPSCSHSPFAC